jgi:hypothetical protein
MKQILLDIIIENKMTLAIFCKQIKRIVIGEVFKLAKGRFRLTIFNNKSK